LRRIRQSHNDGSGGAEKVKQPAISEQREVCMCSTIFERKSRSRLIWIVFIGGSVLVVVGLIIFLRMNHVGWDRIVNTILMIATIVLAVFAAFQAHAAIQTAKAAMNFQRGWILLGSINAPSHIEYLENEYRASLQLEFKFKVIGVVPIKIINSQIRLHFVELKSASSNEPDLSIPPNYGKNPGFSQNSGIGRIYYSGHEFSIKRDFENTSISHEEFSKFGKGENILCAYGVIKYQDAYEGAVTKETRFCYVYQQPPNPFAKSHMSIGKSISIDGNGFRVGGPDAYNSAS
jgi:hypothetical protein